MTTEVILPRDSSIHDFFGLSTKDKVMTIRLGLTFLSDGNNNLQKWNNGEWESTIKTIEEKSRKEQNKLLEQLRKSEAQYNDYVHSAKIRQDALTKEIADNERRRCMADIEQLRSQNQSLTSQINSHLSTIQKLSHDYDERQEKKLCEQRNYYDNKLDEIRKEKDLVMERFTQQVNNSAVKGRHGEEWIFGKLNMTFPKAEIEDTHTQPGRGDFILREDGVTMMIEAKNYSRNVQKTEIDKFYRDIDNQANSDIQCALFVSLKTGICSKSDFELEVRNGIPVIFIHSLEDNFINLLLAWKFFRLIVTQGDIDLTSKEICDGFKNTAKELKRNFTKMKKNADKYHSETLNTIAEQETNIIKLYNLTCIKF